MKICAIIAKIDGRKDVNLIREPAVAGMFYPDDPAILRREIEGYLKRTVFEPINGTISGLISPHAGYMYSGEIAAYGYKAISEMKYDTVIIISPSHRKYFDGAAIMERGGYETPLGTVMIDDDVAADILKGDDIVRVDIDAHTGEHSLEVQIPFLQVVLRDFRIVPIIMGTQDRSVCERLARVIYNALKNKKRKVLVVGSTDLSHYYPYGIAKELDSVIVGHLNRYDIEGLIADLRRERCEACGSGPLITTMMVSRMLGANLCRVLKYANSGDTAGDKSAVVGYLSAILYRLID